MCVLSGDIFIIFPNSCSKLHGKYLLDALYALFNLTKEDTNSWGLDSFEHYQHFSKQVKVIYLLWSI